MNRSGKLAPGMKALILEQNDILEALLAGFSETLSSNKCMQFLESYKRVDNPVHDGELDSLDILQNSKRDKVTPLNSRKEYSNDEYYVQAHGNSIKLNRNEYMAYLVGFGGGDIEGKERWEGGKANRKEDNWNKSNSIDSKIQNNSLQQFEYKKNGKDFRPQRNRLDSNGISWDSSANYNSETDNLYNSKDVALENSPNYNNSESLHKKENHPQAIRSITQPDKPLPNSSFKSYLPSRVVHSGSRSDYLPPISHKNTISPDNIEDDQNRSVIGSKEKIVESNLRPGLLPNERLNSLVSNKDNLFNSVNDERRIQDKPNKGIDYTSMRISDSNHNTRNMGSSQLLEQDQRYNNRDMYYPHIGSETDQSENNREILKPYLRAEQEEKKNQAKKGTKTNSIDASSYNNGRDSNSLNIYNINNLHTKELSNLELESLEESNQIKVTEKSWRSKSRQKELQMNNLDYGDKPIDKIGEHTLKPQTSNEFIVLPNSMINDQQNEINQAERKDFDIGMNKEVAQEVKANEKQEMIENPKRPLIQNKEKTISENKEHSLPLKQNQPVKNNKDKDTVGNKETALLKHEGQLLVKDMKNPVSKLSDPQVLKKKDVLNDKDQTQDKKLPISLLANSEQNDSKETKTLLEEPICPDKIALNPSSPIPEQYTPKEQISSKNNFVYPLEERAGYKVLRNSTDLKFEDVEKTIELAKDTKDAKEEKLDQVADKLSSSNILQSYSLPSKKLPKNVPKRTGLALRRLRVRASCVLFLVKLFKYIKLDMVRRRDKMYSFYKEHIEDIFEVVCESLII